MEAPYSIASLPTPLDKEHGTVYAAPVNALKGSKKRKRHEVAVTVDGEGVSIYNVQSQAQVASYAVPPQTYFCCRPCSIFTRATTDRPAQRRTYVVAKDAPTKASRRLVCFTENVRSSKSESAEYSAPTKLECMVPGGEVCNVDMIASTSGGVSALVVAYQNGRVVSVSSDLSQMQEARPPFRKPSPDEVEYATMIDTETASKGMLKGREDVLAALEQTGTGGVRGDLLCQIVRAGNRRRFDAWRIQGQTSDGLRLARKGLQAVMSFELPRSSRKTSTQAHHEVHGASGKLYSLLEGKLTVYDLGDIVPRILRELGTRDQPITSFVRLSTSMLVATSGTKATVYETAHGSLQATGSLQVSSFLGGPPKKRKRDDDALEELQTSSNAVSAFSELGLFVFLSGTQLSAIQLGNDILSRTQGKERPARLTDVLGHGNARRALNVRDDEQRGGDDRQTWTAQVDSLIENGDLEGLESLVANDKNLGRQRKPEGFRRHVPLDQDTDSVNGDAAVYDDLWPLPEPLDPTQINLQRVLHLLGKVFSYAPDEPQIEIRIASRKLLEWLALTGQLNRQSVEKALRPDDGGVQREPIQPGDIMTAVAEIDEDFELMHSLLSLPAQWELSEVIQAMCLLIRSFDATPESAEQMERTLALLGAPETNGDEHMLNGDVSMTNGDVAMVNGDAESHVESESKAAETELEHVERILMSGLEVRSDTLRVILERLHAFPARDVTATMRAMMSQKELVFLIHMLRIELADGGWTSRYAGAGADEEQDGVDGEPKLSSMVDVIPSDGETGPSNQAIRAIGDLLNCAVDAVGTSGWLVGLSSDALGTEELLNSLRAEVSAGLEGCYEANTLGTFLADLEMFVASKPKPRKGQRDEVAVDAVLPVGGKAEPTEVVGKRSAGKKSKQVIALEKSRRVGKYSLDRIRF